MSGTTQCQGLHNVRDHTKSVTTQCQGLHKVRGYTMSVTTQYPTLTIFKTQCVSEVAIGCTFVNDKVLATLMTIAFEPDQTRMVQCHGLGLQAMGMGRVREQRRGIKGEER